MIERLVLVVGTSFWGGLEKALLFLFSGTNYNYNTSNNQLEIRSFLNVAGCFVSLDQSLLTSLYQGLQIANLILTEKGKMSAAMLSLVRIMISG